MQDKGSIPATAQGKRIGREGWRTRHAATGNTAGSHWDEEPGLASSALRMYVCIDVSPAPPPPPPTQGQNRGCRAIGKGGKEIIVRQSEERECVKPNTYEEGDE